MRVGTTSLSTCVIWNSPCCTWSGNFIFEIDWEPPYSLMRDGTTSLSTCMIWNSPCRTRSGNFIFKIESEPQGILHVLKMLVEWVQTSFSAGLLRITLWSLIVVRLPSLIDFSWRRCFNVSGS